MQWVVEIVKEAPKKEGGDKKVKVVRREVKKAKTAKALKEAKTKLAKKK
jgi:hypothetical protein